MSSATGKRRSVGHQLSVEEQALNIIAQEAETRDAKSHAFLAEARKIRTNERERIKKVQEEDGDEDAQKPVENAQPETIPSRSISSDRPSLEHSSSRDGTIDIEEKYKKVMMSNAQLDNEKQSLRYQLELLKDNLNDKEEELIELTRQHRITSHEKDRHLQDLKNANSKCDKLCHELRQRDQLLKNSGLAVVSVDGVDVGTDQDNDSMSSAVLTQDCIEMLCEYTGSLGDRLKKLFEDKSSLYEENKRLQHELDMEKSRSALMQKYQPSGENSLSQSILSGSSQDGQILDAETQKNFTETKLKLKKAEQEITTLQGSVTRLDTQMNRYKMAAENSERAEEELKQEKRKIQKELREALDQIDELSTKNTHLMKRLEKAKIARNLGDAN